MDTHSDGCRRNLPGPNTVRQARSSLLRWVLGLLGLVALGTVVYSIYVGVHEPDPQETLVLGQSKLAAGSPAGLRVLVRNRVSGKPVADAEVTLSLRGRGTTTTLGTFRTDATGSLTNTLLLPELPAGEYELALETTSSLGSDHILKQVELQHPARMLLSSDKPLYQPGQTLHLRSLTLNARTQKPFAGEAVTFEVKDAKGNKVFKETHKSSAYGIASADFVLASEVNLGRYQISASSATASTERTVEVKRYVLPKFKIQLAADRSYYLPGQTVSGTVQARYFFGQPVRDGSLKLTATTRQEQPVVVKELQGRTDETGKFAFQFVLPDFSSGTPQKPESAPLDLRVEVQDSAQHVEQTTLYLPVAASELELAAIPEAGTWVPGVENLLYVIATYPDGRPAPCQIFLNGSAFPADAAGVSVVKVSPSELNRRLEIQARDVAGHRANMTYQPDPSRPAPNLLVRTDKAVYQTGQTAQLTLLSPEKQSTVFLDLIKDGQTVLTRSVTLHDYTGSCALALPASWVGALQLHAYILTPDGEDRGCTRLVYVHPASGLQVSSKLSQPSYRPGEVAKVDFTVTDAAGRPAPAALGIAAVDESVFALSDSRPGWLQQCLDGEGDLLQPRPQIKSFASPARVLSGTEQNQALAQAYLASWTPQPTGPSVEQLIKDGEVSARTVEHIRQVRGTPAYERFRRSPQFAEVIDLLENGHGLYSFREATGPAKLHAAEARRKAYFRRLEQYLGVATVGSLFFLPLLLLFYFARPVAGVIPEALAHPKTSQYIQLASLCYNSLGMLVVLPMLCYPCGLLALEHSPMRDPGWLLLGFESCVVLGTLAALWMRLQQAGALNLGLDLVPLRAALLGFLLQFVVFRVGMAWGFTHTLMDMGGLILLWWVGSALVPFIVLASLGSHVRRELKTRGLLNARPGALVVEALVAFALLAVLAAMLLPALATAKSRSAHITLQNELSQLAKAKQMADMDSPPSASTPAAPRVRHDFPETLLWRPELITDDHGRASLEIPLADSITTWRASVDAVSAAGQMGSTELPLTVFQDFFVDLDLPLALSLGDQVAVPITCYNYLKEPQDLRLSVAGADWFESAVTNLAVHLEPNEVKSVSLPLKVLRVGTHGLRVTAQGTKLGDAIEREVRVLPTGERMEHIQNGVLKDQWTDTFSLSPDAIPDSQSLSVKFYPSRFSEVVEGLESIFQAPYGCFEQTSATTYPNLLVLDYLKRMGRLNPQVEAKAREFINTGYQRLLTFEVPGGGFEWFGHSPAHVGLTAYGILEFTDMSQVHPVDSALLERTRQWLFSQQHADGSWNQSGGMDTWSAQTPVTAYVAWALAESGDRSSHLDRALDYLRTHPQELASTYQKALAANALLARDPSDAFGRQLASQIQQAAVPGDEKTLHWTSSGQSITYSRGFDMSVETTALSALALIKAGTAPETVKQALGWLSRQKARNGTWGSTQATILAMRALLAGSGAALGQGFDSTVTLLLNGQAVESFHVNQGNSDVLKQFDLTRYLQPGENHIALRQTPAGELPFQLTGTYWLPTASAPALAATPATPALQIEVKYDRTTLAVADPLHCSVAVSNHAGQGINMALVELSIPAGFDLDPSAFEALQQAGRLAKYEVNGTQAILYLRELPSGAPCRFEYSLRAKYPLRVQTRPSTIYEYYQPTNRAQSQPVTLQVLGS